MNRKDEGLDYLKQYPKLNKWINKCVCCGSIGYSPDLPQNITTNFGQGEFITAKAQFIRKYFSPLEVDEMSICKTCQKFFYK